MSWFKRQKQGIQTSTAEKKEVPEGLWAKCPACKQPVSTRDLEDNQYVCPCENAYHFRIGSELYFQILFDGGEYQELDHNMSATDPLHFTDKKSYSKRIKEAQQKTGLMDALRSARGRIHNINAVVCCMDFDFIGGSMGSVVGEKIARATDFAREHRFPLIIISKSGGARMMESAFSLMQMAKTSAKLALLAEAKVPYISVLTDPTTGGVTASFAMLGDVNIAEPGALIGFAGPRVIRETIGKDLPEGFQSAEFLLEHGFVDKIVDRRDLRNVIAQLLGYMLPDEKSQPQIQAQHAPAENI